MKQRDQPLAAGMQEAEVTGATLHELYSRLVLDTVCGNTDDHARNYAAFWDGQTLRLTPACDICPQGRTGPEASQAVLRARPPRRQGVAALPDHDSPV